MVKVLSPGNVSKRFAQTLNNCTFELVAFQRY